MYIQIELCPENTLVKFPKQYWTIEHWMIHKWPFAIKQFMISDGSGLGPGLESPPARPIFARPGPPEARSKKPESPGAFFGPKIGRFSTYFWPNLGKIMGPFVPQIFSLVLGRKSAKNRPIFGPFSADFWPSSKFKNFNYEKFWFHMHKTKKMCILYFGKARKKARSPM